MKITTQPGKYHTGYVIQHNGISIPEVEDQLHAMGGLDAYSYGLIPFSDEITGLENIPTDRNLVALGSISLIHRYLNGKVPDNWVIFYDEQKFDQDWYKPLLGPELLNNDASCMLLRDALDFHFGYDVFIKPTNDLKMFAGVIVEKGQTLTEVLSSMQNQTLNETQPVIFAPIQQLRREFRVIVVDGVPTGFSQYKDSDGRVKLGVLNLADRDKLYFKALALHAQYHPADVYTIDFAEVGPLRKLKVVEYNCFNCSGLYKIDRNAVYTEIAKYLDKHY